MRIALCLTLLFLSTSCIFVGHRRRGGCIRVCTVEAQAAVTPTDEVTPETIEGIEEVVVDDVRCTVGD